MLNIYSVSAQNKGDAISLPVQYAHVTGINKSQAVFHYAHLSNYYLNVNSKHAEKYLLDIRTNQTSFLLDVATQQNQKFGILLIVCVFLLIIAISFFVLYLKKKKTPVIPEINIEPYEEKITFLHNRLKELEQNNTDLQKGYEELQIKYNDIQKTSEVKDKLIPMIAHDIRSPLAALQSTLTLTRENIINPEEFQKLSFALEADVFNLRGMLDNMLLWAKEQMFETKITKAKFDLSEISRDVILMYRNNLVGKNITLHNYLPQHLEVTTDREIISAVFRNLFSNAVKFTETGKNIYISQIFFNGKAYISVKDEGKGMQTEMINKLNNKEHISTRGTANEKGTGLGLLFSREMLGRLDEVFDITSYPNQGTSVTFSVSLS
ncbi:MAG: HAMP domain-containing sensor histidine kinase [Parafilimonas sp.]